MNDGQRLRMAKWVRETCGGWSDMTLWRRLHEYGGHFPKPVYIARRRYWVEAEVLEWLKAQREGAQ